MDALIEDLGRGLVMRTAAGQEDVERVAAFNGLIHGPELAVCVRRLLADYPGIEGRDVIFVEDTATGEIASSLLLLPWTLRYGGVRLSVGEMGMVGTLESHRRRGLVRIQTETFMQRLRARGCLLSLIQGIPYFYRQFGYEYAMPLEGGLRLSGRELPAPPEAAFTFRQATSDDLPALLRLYDAAAQDLAVHTARDQLIWRYLLAEPAGSALRCETWLVEDVTGEAVGYFRLPDYHFHDELAVNEVSRLGGDAALVVLHWLKQAAAERGKPGIRLNLPANCTLMQLARSLDAHDLGTYAWQVHVPDLAALLRAIGPVLEQRLAASSFAGLSREITICFYRDSVTLRFEAGKLKDVSASGPTQGAINFPPLTFTPVLFGHRTVEQMRLAYPDISVDGSVRLLFETMFPPLAAFIYPSY
ncbi:MAG TPA: GNAT family N-acetyltransferase [Anaerolineae bacterium]|nr:GNAT family N-acetyltransferase [Anaerolineae bacterium]